MQTTQNYSLKKPEETDVITISDLNDNMDIIDEVMKKFVNRRILKLMAAGWSGSYPFTQAVDAAGIAVADDIKVIGVYIPANATLEQVKAWNKAAGYLMCNPDGVADGKITFKAYKKPTVDFQILTEGA
jgi:hypothetical protein